MPFDANPTFIATEAHETIAQLRISPVDPDVVRRHKAQMIEAFQRESPFHSNLIRRGWAAWQTARIPRKDLILGLSQPFFAERGSGAPPKVLRLAQEVADRSATALFSMEFFDKDPILHIAVGDETACLGIWNKGRVIALAGLDGKPATYDIIGVRFSQALARTVACFRRTV